MAEYIEREKAIEHIETHLPYRCSEDFIEGQKDCVEQLKSLPASDVVEVVHGEWIKPTMINGRTFDIPHCSACGDVPCDTKNYCPNCGAKMDGDKK